ncbi:MAG: hypothetical protein ABIX46_03020, partial [Burkholderiaceae bacterium]
LPVGERRMSTRPTHRFESPDSVQTLSEALAEYVQTAPNLKRGPSLSAEAQAFFSSHDVVHVVYGCGTSMVDEAVVKLATLLGTTGGVDALKGYREPDALDIYRDLPWADTLVALLLSPYLIARTIWRCHRQCAKWPWVGYDEHLNTPLKQLREGFGIAVSGSRRRG